MKVGSELLGSERSPVLQALARRLGCHSGSHGLSGLLSLLLGLFAGGAALGQIERVANSTLTLPLDPGRDDYRVVPVMTSLPHVWGITGFAAPPGESNRLFVANKEGFVDVITNLAAPTYTRFLDLSQKTFTASESGLSSLAFHPGFATNRTFFLYYTALTNTPNGLEVYDQLSRFEVDGADPNRAVPESETPLIRQLDRDANHNAGSLLFGPDGYLYLSLGDEGSANNFFQNAQRIDRNFFSGVLRIDVDQRPGNLTPNPHPAVAPGAYRVPADNPFVGTTHFQGKPIDPAQLRTEFYAIGLRNPWRLWLDPPTGNLYCTDTGQALREEVNLIVAGGNYGWAYREGTLNWPWPPDLGEVEFVDPILEYAHEDGNVAIVAGLLYRGSALPRLDGAYVFNDWSGKIGVFRPQEGGGTPVQWIAYNEGVTALGIHPGTSELLVADSHAYGGIMKLAQVTSPGPPIPPRLSEAGIFSDLTTLTPNPGIVPYEINVPFWSDHALKRRWFSVPNTNDTIGFSAEGNWDVPAGTVWVKHFDLELTTGEGASAKRVETRVLVRNNNGIYGATYRWNPAGTDADLVSPDGADDVFQIQEGSTVRTQRWHYPSRNECLACHTAVAGWALGFGTAQVNRDVIHGAGAENQIAAWSRAGYLREPVTSVHTLPVLAPPEDSAWSREFRVRSYLAANCAHCHQPGGLDRPNWDARIALPLSKIHVVQGVLVNDFGIPGARVVVPGDLSLSILYQRLAQLPGIHMPPLATSVLNQGAIDLVGAWITNDLPLSESYAVWADRSFEVPSSPEAASDADPDQDGLSNYAEYLLHEPPLSPITAWRLTSEFKGGVLTLRFNRLANRGFIVEGTSNLSDPGSWQPLDVPSNRRFIPASDTPTEVVVPTDVRQNQFLRVRIYEP